MLLELLIAQQGEKAKHNSSVGGSIISWWNVCDSSEPGGLCPDANLESSYYCIWERESAENSLWGEKQNKTKKTLFWQKKKKKKSSLHSVITFRYLIYHLHPWNLLCPLLPLPWQREGGQTFPRKDRVPVAESCLRLVRKENKVDATSLSTMLMLLFFVKVFTPVGIGLTGNWHLEPRLEESWNSVSNIWQNYFFFIWKLSESYSRVP